MSLKKTSKFVCSCLHASLFYPFFCCSPPLLLSSPSTSWHLPHPQSHPELASTAVYSLTCTSPTSAWSTAVTILCNYWPYSGLTSTSKPSDVASSNAYNSGDDSNSKYKERLRHRLVVSCEHRISTSTPTNVLSLPTNTSSRAPSSGLNTT
ncbi:hypothetical protein CPC08DRAFT_246442 [Agrocybe pediades]|nr:hypothetical protein CPC08DRAFT_246442 [Agrocybe pediades]